MAGNKTKATAASVESYISAISDDVRRKDCETLVKVMGRATKERATMWGSSIVGFGSYHYRYESGREGDSCLTGFSSRKGDITIYLTGETLAREALMSKLGRHKTGKGCLYVRQLSDVDLKTLEALVVSAFEERRRSHS
jgi:hypothetical protein